MSLGPFVRARRRELGLTQDQVAEGMDADQTTVSQIELGKALPSREYRRRLASALNVDERELVEREIADSRGTLPDESLPNAVQLPAPPPFQVRELDYNSAEPDDNAVVSYVESLPSPAFQSWLAEERSRREWPSYAGLCRGFFRIWASRDLLALVTLGERFEG